MGVRVRLLELQTEADSLLATRGIGRAAPDPNLRGWGALLPLEPPALHEGFKHAGLAVLRGSSGVLVLGSLAQLWSAGRSLADGFEKGPGKALAVELMLRAAAIESNSGKAGLGHASGRMGDHEPPGWVLPRRALPIGRTLVMGIINVTPDSFSDGGRTFDAASAVERGLQLAAEGVDIIDVGGESTRPTGARPVSAQEELARIGPVVQRLARQANVPISIDTMKSEVARAALDAGAEIVNDVSALAADPAMGALVAERGAGLVLMHMRGTPQTMQEHADYRDLLGEVIDELAAALVRAQEAGIAAERICLDPGYGFAKEAQASYQLLRRQRELLQLGRPLLAGVSRKSFIGRAVGQGPSERLHGTLSAVALAVANGAAIVRVHDVDAARDAALVADALRTDGASLP
jgi:dihydropteroate synthase